MNSIHLQYSYVETLIPNASECDYIWSKGF